MNPFVFGKVVGGDNFYDRKEEKEKIISNIKSGNNLVIYAPRRYGKTSLVYNIIQEMKEEYKFIYLDFMMIYSKESFIDLYSKKIFESKSNIKKVLKSFVEFVKGIKPVVTYDEDMKPNFSLNYEEREISNESLESIIDLPENIASESNKYVVVFDEFQEINKLNGESFEALLRSKIQFHKNVSYIFLGSKTHILKDMFNNKNRPFYNSALPMTIGKLPEKDTINYLKSRFAKSNIKLKKNLAEKIIEYSDNIPYYIQLLASQIWQIAINEKIKIDEEVIHKALENTIAAKSDYYYEIFDNNSAYNKKVLLSIAINGENVYSNDYAHRFRLSAVSSTQRAIKTLLQNGLIEKNNRSYSIADPFFKRFLLEMK